MKKIPKKYLQSNETLGYKNKIKLQKGFITYFVSKTNKNTWNYEIYWTDTRTGSDTTLVIKKNQKFNISSDKNIDEIVYKILGIAKDYFETHPDKLIIDANIATIQELRLTY